MCRALAWAVPRDGPRLAVMAAGTAWGAGAELFFIGYLAAECGDAVLELGPARPIPGEDERLPPERQKRCGALLSFLPRGFTGGNERLREFGSTERVRELDEQLQ